MFFEFESACKSLFLCCFSAYICRQIQETRKNFSQNYFKYSVTTGCSIRKKFSLPFITLHETDEKNNYLLYYFDTHRTYSADII